MITPILLIAIALLFTLAAAYFFMGVSKETKRLIKTPKNEPEIDNHEEYSHMIVHELRAPIVAIKDSASVMLSDKLSDGDKKKMLIQIHDQANKLLGQISTILDAAKVQEGKLTLKKTQGDIGAVVKEELSLFQPEAKRKNISLMSDIKTGLPTFFFDNVRITEALNNILSNSLKYTNENGVIRVSVGQTGENIVLSVADNGIGIPEEKQSRLFTKFGQLTSPENKDNQNLSSGLGLYITKWIIEEHKGTIKIDSEEGKGTTTTFTLPIEKN